MRRIEAPKQRQEKLVFILIHRFSCNEKILLITLSLNTLPSNYRLRMYSKKIKNIFDNSIDVLLKIVHHNNLTSLYIKVLIRIVSYNLYTNQFLDS